MTAVVDFIEDTFEAAGDFVGDVFEAAGDVVESVVDNIVEPVFEAVGDVVEAAAEDPIGTMAKVATAIVAPQLLPLVSAANTLVQGGDIEDALVSAATTYVSQGIGQAVGSLGDQAAAAAQYGTDFGSAQTAMLAAQESGLGSLVDVAGNLIGSTAAGTISTGDPLQALINGGISAGTAAVTSQIPGFSDLPINSQRAINNVVSSTLMGGDPSQTLVNAAINAGLAEARVEYLQNQKQQTETPISEAPSAESPAAAPVAAEPPTVEAPIVTAQPLYSFNEQSLAGLPDDVQNSIRTKLEDAARLRADTTEPQSARAALRRSQAALLEEQATRLLMANRPGMEITGGPDKDAIAQLKFDNPYYYALGENQKAAVDKEFDLARDKALFAQATKNLGVQFASPAAAEPTAEGIQTQLATRDTVPVTSDAGLPSLQTETADVQQNEDGTVTRTLVDGTQIIEDSAGNPIETKSATQIQFENTAAEPSAVPTIEEVLNKRQEDMTPQDWAALYAMPTTDPVSGETITGKDLADYPVQDLGIDETNWESYQNTLADMAEQGTLPSQWANNEDGTKTFTNDDGSSITINEDGEIVDVTETTDTPWQGTTTPPPSTTTGNQSSPNVKAPNLNWFTQERLGTAARLGAAGIGAAALLGALDSDDPQEQAAARKILQLQWNQQAINPTEGGIAYGQQYFNPQFTEVTAAQGGLMSLAGGGMLGSYSDGGRLLRGPGDGMSDSIPASIAQKQPARLADGEFVIPADVVSHLGNGSTEAGSRVLYEMMNRVRKARTGNPKQGKQINPKKFMPK